MSPLSVTTGAEGVGAGVATGAGAGSVGATSTAASTLGAGEDSPPCIL